MNYLISASTDIGISKKTNQDSFSLRLSSTACGNIVFAVLCDGMGGLAKGEVASSNVIRAFREWEETRLPQLVNQGITDADIRQDWSNIIRMLNDLIKSYGASGGIRLGTTITALLLTDTRYYIVNVGDTRCYEIYDDLYQLTKDHSLVQREIDMGNLTPEQAEVDPRRSVLLQCIGASDAVYPEFFFGTPKENAVYMLCSDGFRHVISKEEIFDGLQPARMTSPDGMKSQIVNLINLDKGRMEKDNITVLAVRTY